VRESELDSMDANTLTLTHSPSLTLTHSHSLTRGRRLTRLTHSLTVHLRSVTHSLTHSLRTIDGQRRARALPLTVTHSPTHSHSQSLTHNSLWLHAIVHGRRQNLSSISISSFSPIYCPVHFVIPICGYHSNLFRRWNFLNFCGSFLRAVGWTGCFP